jgi:hypothetical protein
MYLARERGDKGKGNLSRPQKLPQITSEFYLHTTFVFDFNKLLTACSRIGDVKLLTMKIRRVSVNIGHKWHYTLKTLNESRG